MTTSSGIARQPSGIPTGGEFAPTAKTASGVTLGGTAADAHEQAWAAEKHAQSASLRDIAKELLAAHPEAAHLHLRDHDEEPGDVIADALVDAEGNGIDLSDDEDDRLWELVAPLEDRLMRDRDDVAVAGSERMGYTYELDLAKAAAQDLPRTTAEKVADAKGRAAGIAAAAAADAARLDTLRAAGDMDAYDRCKDDVDRLDLIERQRAELLSLIECL